MVPYNVIGDFPPIIICDRHLLLDYTETLVAEGTNDGIVGSKGSPCGPILCIACNFLHIWCLPHWPLFKSDFFLLLVVGVEEVPREGPSASSAPSSSSGSPNEEAPSVPVEDKNSH